MKIKEKYYINQRNLEFKNNKFLTKKTRIFYLISILLKLPKNLLFLVLPSFIFFLTITLFVFFASAEIMLPPEQDIFGEVSVVPLINTNEQQNYEYSILNLNSNITEINITTLLSCPYEPYPNPKIIPILFSNNTIYKSRITDRLLLSDSTVQQVCTAGIIDTRNNILLDEKNFFISVKPSLNTKLVTCKDVECINPTNFFRIGEPVYIDLNPKLYLKHNNILLNINPPKEKRSIQVSFVGSYTDYAVYSKKTTTISNDLTILPGFGILFYPNKTGVYTITTTINITNYKPLFLEEHFFVIKNNSLQGELNRK
ncbi:MAG: hypothetical protein QXG00_04725 [Candidatus Woesearchaeota archaeon]